jgi:hypothetical protein
MSNGTIKHALKPSATLMRERTVIEETPHMASVGRGKPGAVLVTRHTPVAPPPSQRNYGGSTSTSNKMVKFNRP